MNKSKVIVVAAVFALLALLPQWAGKYEVDLVTKIMIFAVFALSLELLVGSTGLVCFGQAAFFGIGERPSTAGVQTSRVFHTHERRTHAVAISDGCANSSATAAMH